MALLYSKIVSSEENLSKILINNPYILHFSGHGLENSEANLGGESVFYKGQGDMLLVENNYCSGSLLTEVKVKEVLNTFEHDIKLVVILSCHSERVGEIFSNANVGHVICIKQADEIADEFCIKFAYLFYKILLETESSTICKAYETTLKKLSSEMKNTNLKEEEKKFCIKHNHAGQD